MKKAFLDILYDQRALLQTHITEAQTYADGPAAQCDKCKQGNKYWQTIVKEKTMYLNNINEFIPKYLKIHLATIV